MTIKERIKFLTDEINMHRKLYYNDAQPEISDYQYDLLEKELKELEEKHPHFKLPYSPTSRVGGEPVDSFENILHSEPMLSLENAYTYEELIDFDNRIKKEIGTNFKYTVELKIDGVSLSLIYNNGILFQAITRGDGEKGDNIIENAKTIKAIPLNIQDTAFDDFIVRGEVFLSFSEFNKINKMREEKEDPLFANPRNAAAGSVRLKDSKIAAKRNLNMFCYHILSENKLPSSHFERLQLLKQLGFNINSQSKTANNIEEVWNICQSFEELRHSLDYPVDGVVIKLDNTELWKKLGTTSKFPKFAIAFKFQAEQVVTKILDVTFQVGRTGVITPVAELEPVFLAGTNVKRATLHNFEEIVRKDIKIGDQVFIEKGGEIIPKVVKVVISKRTGKELDIKTPDYCPLCKSKTVYSEEEVAIRCINNNCPGIVVNSILHFVSRDGMDIQGFGISLVEKLVEKKDLQSIADIYTLTKEQLASLERMGEKSAENIINQIEQSKKIGLSKFIFALGIRFTGEKASKIIAKHFKSLDNIINASVLKLSEIDGIGEKTAVSVKDFFLDFNNIAMVKKMIDAGLVLEEEAPSTSDSLTGKIYVLTGELENFTRKEAKTLLELNGAMVSSSVSKNTTAVITGENPGSKLDKAKTLGIEILTEEFLNSLIKDK